MVKRNITKSVERRCGPVYWRYDKCTEIQGCFEHNCNELSSNLLDPVSK